MRASLGSAVAPSAASIPAPPSVVADPPSPTITRVAPAVTASLTSCPTPKVVASSPRRSGSGVRCRPQAWALSTYAVSPSSSSDPGTSSPYGPETVTASSSPPREACSTSTKPGPPSAIGTSSSSSSGARRRQPSAIACAASTALSVPANLSGAIRTRMPPIQTPAPRLVLT